MGGFRTVLWIAACLPLFPCEAYCPQSVSRLRSYESSSPLLSERGIHPHLRIQLWKERGNGDEYIVLESSRNIQGVEQRSWWLGSAGYEPGTIQTNDGRRSIELKEHPFDPLQRTGEYTETILPSGVTSWLRSRTRGASQTRTLRGPQEEFQSGSIAMSDLILRGQTGPRFEHYIRVLMLDDGPSSHLILIEEFDRLFSKFRHTYFFANQHWSSTTEYTLRSIEWLPNSPREAPLQELIVSEENASAILRFNRYRMKRWGLLVPPSQIDLVVRTDNL